MLLREMLDVREMHATNFVLEGKIGKRRGKIENPD
jgi:hypothetical protein